MIRAMGEDPKAKELAERVLEIFIRERAHLRYPACREMGLTAHAVCIRATYADNESALLDPGRKLPPSVERIRCEEEYQRVDEKLSELLERRTSADY